LLYGSREQGDQSAEGSSLHPRHNVFSNSSLIFTWIFSPYGLVNSVLSLFGVKPQNWLLNPYAALPAIMSVAIWGTSAYFMVVFIAGLNSIPGTLYEAAAIDGAKSAWKRFRYVTLPLLKPSLYVVIVLGLIGALQIFDLSYVMTNGGPGYSTYTALRYIYNYAFSYNRMGYASAASFILFAIIFILTLVMRRYLEVRRWS